MKLTIIAAFLIGCSTESTEPITESESALQVPLCSTWAVARSFREYPLIAAWYAAPCPAGMAVQMCGNASQEAIPGNCAWFDGQPYGMFPTCCPSGETLPLTCDSDDDCPASGAECYEPWCNVQMYQCMQTPAFKLGESCDGGAGICNRWGIARSEITGLLIPELGGPIICDHPEEIP